jgi:hypothetical protein
MAELQIEKSLFELQGYLTVLLWNTSEYQHLMLLSESLASQESKLEIGELEVVGVEIGKPDTKLLGDLLFDSLYHQRSFEEYQGTTNYYYLTIPESQRN